MNTTLPGGIVKVKSIEGYVTRVLLLTGSHWILLNLMPLAKCLQNAIGSAFVPNGSTFINQIILL